MSVIKETVTLTKAADVIGIPPRVLRHVAANLPLLTDPTRCRGRWRKWSLVDLVRVACVAKLLEFGITLPSAIEILDAGLDGLLLAFALAGIEADADFLLRRLEGRTLHIVPEPEGIHVYAAPRFNSPAQGAAVLILDLELIARDVLCGIGETTLAARSGPPLGRSARRAQHPKDSRRRSERTAKHVLGAGVAPVNGPLPSHTSAGTPAKESHQ
jgi:hypothetical protein